MTRLTPEQEALTAIVGRNWAKYKAETIGLEARIRAKVEAEEADALRAIKTTLAESIRVALEAGATKVAVRAVTSKNPGTMERILEVLTSAKEAAEEDPAKAALTIAWADETGDILHIQLDPESVRETPVSRDNAALWSGFFDIYRRGDGKVFVDPLDGTLAATDEHGVTEWLRADRANEEAVIAWVMANPQA